MYGKMGPLVMLWYQLHLSGVISKFAEGCPLVNCVPKRLGRTRVKPLICSAIQPEEVCKQVACERSRLTLYIKHANFSRINIQ